MTLRSCGSRQGSISGHANGDFGFNTYGGRCEVCAGDGQGKRIAAVFGVLAGLPHDAVSQTQR
jgi:hypothetical protein